jgi:hypothetical protein
VIFLSLTACASETSVAIGSYCYCSRYSGVPSENSIRSVVPALSENHGIILRACHPVRARDISLRSVQVAAAASSRESSCAINSILRCGGHCSGSIARQRSSLASLDGSHLPGSARFAFLVLGHERRQLLWFEVTRHPTAAWLVRQVTEAFPWTSTPCVYRKSPCLWQAHAMLVAGSRT